jgi:hypothetical protein
LTLLDAGALSRAPQFVSGILQRIDQAARSLSYGFCALYNVSGFPLTTNSSESIRKAQIDAVLLKLPGVSARKINGLDAYFVSDRMFACISGRGVGLRLPVSTATELQFSRDNVVPFQPGGIGSSREWIQIDRSDAADYEKDLELFRASLEFVKAGRTR